VVLLFVLSFAAAVWAQTSAAPPATIYLIRHAEKLTDGREDLSPAGFARAALLPELFLPSRGNGRTALARPDFLFATHASKKSNRPVETITPLSAALHLPIDASIMNDDYSALASLLLSGKYAGKVVLVSWHHGKLPALAAALGAKPPYDPWPEQQFDRIWRIDYRDGRAILTDLPQQLMPGDSR
jgi:hypothetical protein